MSNTQELFADGAAVSESDLNSNLPATVQFSLVIKPSIRKTLTKITFELERKRLNWEMLLAEIFSAVSSKELNIDAELTTENISKVLKYFNSSRCNISNAPILTRENMMSLFESSYRNYVAFLRKESTANSGFKIRLILLLSDLTDDQGYSSFYPSGIQEDPGKHSKNGIRKKGKMRLPSALQGTGMAPPTVPFVPNCLRFSCIKETQYGTKRQQCALEISIPDIVEAYKSIESHLLSQGYSNNQNVTVTTGQSDLLDVGFSTQ